MAIAEQHVSNIVANVWELIVGLDILPMPVSENQSNRNGQMITGLIYFSGSWQGTLSLACSLDLAKKVAANMFEMPVERVASSEIKDALGELINIVGGNVTTKLPPACKLSLPSIQPEPVGLESLNKSTSATTVSFLCANQPLVVHIWENSH